jgi:hypothetical protein
MNSKYVIIALCSAVVGATVGYTTSSYKSNPSVKLNRNQKDFLVELLKGKEIEASKISYETMIKLIEEQYITVNEYNVCELTEKGKDIAYSESQLKEQARKKRNAASRARGAAAKSVGLKKTRYGGWE